jgi:two-component system, LytTR family, sensor kinase
MFSHRYNYWFSGILGIYSFLNGDRLFAVDIEPFALFALVLILTLSVWSLNRCIEKTVTGYEPLSHPLIFQFGISVLTVLILSFISSHVTGLVLGGPFAFTWQNFLLTTAFTSRINLFLNCINAIYFFNQKLHEKAIESEKLKTLRPNLNLSIPN